MKSSGVKMTAIKLTWKTEHRKVADLVPYEFNPRKISPEQAERLTASIEKFNLVEIPAINTDGVIVAGHQRLAIMKAIGRGAEIVDVRVPNRRLTEAEIQEYNLRSNKNTGEWDFELLAGHFDEGMLESVGFDLADIPGISLPPTSEQDEIPKVRKTNIKIGDMFALGEHRLLCGNATEKKDAEKLMGEAKAICVFTDPPYGVSIGKKNAMLNTFQRAGMCLDNLTMDDMKPAELGDMLLKAFTLWRTQMADNCAVFVCSPQGGGLGMMMMMMMMSAGLEVRHIINWVKNSPTFSMGRLDYDYQHEPILYTWTKTHKRKKQGAFLTSLWAVDKPRACDLHPTMKPVELPECAILNHTDKGDIVVDMFGGSGSTLIAAEKTGRRCYM
ncbi:MAG: DNA modification methylase, partial [Patescibacteria group bacterium]